MRVRSTARSKVSLSPTKPGAITTMISGIASIAMMVKNTSQPSSTE